MTHLKANANKQKFTREEVLQNTKDYIEELNEAVEQERKKSREKELKPKRRYEEKKKEIKRSTTDPDSGYMVRDGKPEGYFYLDRWTVDLNTT